MKWLSPTLPIIGLLWASHVQAGCETSLQRIARIGLLGFRDTLLIPGRPAERIARSPQAVVHRQQYLGHGLYYDRKSFESKFSSAELPNMQLIADPTKRNNIFDAKQFWQNYRRM